MHDKKTRMSLVTQKNVRTLTTASVDSFFGGQGARLGYRLPIAHSPHTYLLVALAHHQGGT